MREKHFKIQKCSHVGSSFLSKTSTIIEPAQTRLVALEKYSSKKTERQSFQNRISNYYK